MNYVNGEKINIKCVYEGKELKNLDLYVKKDGKLIGIQRKG